MNAWPVAFACGPDAAAVTAEVARLEPNPGAVPPASSPVRVAFAWRTEAEFSARRALALAGLAGQGEPAAFAARGVHLGSGAALPVAFVFPGQGSQYPGMLAGLRETEPTVAAAFASADAVMAPHLGRRLSDLVWPLSGATREELAAALRPTEVAQPAILAANVALTRVLAALHIAPDLALGHSLGEYAALVAGGALTFEDALAAISVRGPEMARLDAGDRGKMASVTAAAAVVAETLAQVPGYVVAANRNSYTQTVIAGASAAVDAAVARFAAQGVPAVLLPVSHAFHSALVAPAGEALARALATVPIRTPRIPVVSAVTGLRYPDDTQALLAVLSRQLAAPVDFVGGLETLWSLGARLYVEVGPNRVLTGLVREVLGPRGAIACATDHPRWESRHSLAECLATCWAAGAGPGRS